MIFRTVTERITFDNHLKQYFLFWAGDELLIEATDDAEAIRKGEDLLIELGSEN